MSNRRSLFPGALALFSALTLFSTFAVAQQDPSVGNLFIDVYEKKDEAAMKRLIETRTGEFPAEVKSMIEYSMSPETVKEEQDYLFGVAGLIAKMYGDHTGDMRLFEAVKGSYNVLLEKRKAASLNPNVVTDLKKKITVMGEGNWRITVFKLDTNGDLIVEIDVRESAGGSNFTPRIEFKISEKIRDIVKARLPAVKKGKISWSSMGVGLKTVFIE